MALERPAGLPGCNLLLSKVSAEKLLTKLGLESLESRLQQPYCASLMAEGIARTSSGPS